MADTHSLSEMVAEEIRALIARRRTSARKLATDLGVSQTWMSTRLTGTTPIDLNDLSRIAAALNVEVLDLFPRPMPGRVIVTAGTSAEHDHEATRRYPSPPKSTGPIGHPKRTSPNPATRRPARIGAALIAA